VTDRPRLVATDLDGTLLRSDLTMSPQTVRTIRTAAAEGMHVVLVTGRPVRWLKAVYAELGQLLPAVCANGAVVYDPTADRSVHVTTLTPEVLGEVCTRIRAAVPEAFFAMEIDDGRSMRHEVDYPRKYDTGDPAVQPVTSLAELIANPAVKLLVRSGERNPDEFAEVITCCLDGLAEATHSSYTGLVEISAAGVTKAAGLAWFCRQHGVRADEVVAFGDMPNDLPMLAWAGHSVAVANAHPKVLDVVDEVTGSNDEDGVASYLAALLEPAVGAGGPGRLDPVAGPGLPDRGR
jgi:Cof subfamily protein (haloacid dehalogenase superfamily)